MYAVIFTAELSEPDQAYWDTVERLRTRAMEQYGCTGFRSVTQGNQEIAISYWPTLDKISRWREDPEHRAAQRLGRESWYECYQVQVVELLREYHADE